MKRIVETAKATVQSQPHMFNEVMREAWRVRWDVRPTEETSVG